MSRILVTGAAGFIASRVCTQLLEQGRAVVGIDTVNDAYDPRLKDWRLRQLQGRSGFTFERRDICDRDAIDDLVRRAGPFDAIVNLAARAGVRQSIVDPWVYLETNARGTLNLLDACVRHGISKLVLASTSSLYGNHNPRPFREDADTSLPLSPYAASKKAAEALVHSYHHLHGLDVTVLRYFTVFGPAGRPDMSLFRFTQWISEGRKVIILGDGLQERDFTFVDDVARGTIAAVALKGHQVINLGSDAPVRLMDPVRIIERLTGKVAAIEYRPPQAADVRATWANIDRARTVLGWQPKVALEDGLSRLVDWYRENREWAKDVVTEE